MRQSELTVLAPGTAVQVGPLSEDIHGIITAVTLRLAGVLYEVAWWSGRDHRSEWLTAGEVRCQEAPSCRIGFHRSEVAEWVRAGAAPVA